VEPDEEEGEDKDGKQGGEWEWGQGWECDKHQAAAAAAAAVVITADAFGGEVGSDVGGMGDRGGAEIGMESTFKARASRFNRSAEDVGSLRRRSITKDDIGSCCDRTMTIGGLGEGEPDSDGEVADTGSDPDRRSVVPAPTPKKDRFINRRTASSSV
jgi:hypothetical protein